MLMLRVSRREELQHGTECDAVLACQISYVSPRLLKDCIVTRWVACVTVVKRPEWTAGLKLHHNRHSTACSGYIGD